LSIVDATPIAKILPRSPTDGLIARRRLEQLAATARTRRLTVVVGQTAVRPRLVPMFLSVAKIKKALG